MPPYLDAAGCSGKHDIGELDGQFITRWFASIPDNWSEFHPLMEELLRLNDPVRLSWLIALLADSGIEAVVLDQHMSVLEGSASAIPRRLMVRRDEAARARRVLEEAGEFDAAC